MLYMQYIKKEDAAYYVAQRYKMLGLVYPLAAISFWIIYYLVGPQLTDIFHVVSQSPPFFYVLLPYFLVFITVLSFSVSAYYLTKKVDTKLLNQKLKKYQMTEMIRINEILDFKEVYIAMAYFTIILFIFIIGMIQPIYSLTATS